MIVKWNIHGVIGSTDDFTAVFIWGRRACAVVLLSRLFVARWWVLAFVETFSTHIITSTSPSQLIKEERKGNELRGTIPLNVRKKE